jgi:hypothetical protein
MPKQMKGNQIMKNRNRIFAAIAPVLACLALLPTTQAAPEATLPNFNTADGQNALANVTTGAANTAVGWFSLFSDADGSFNTGMGAGTLLFNTSGVDNTAVGAAALLNNTTGSDSTAVGIAALASNTADANTATGAFALHDNTIGGTLETLSTPFGIFDIGPNTAVGSHALERNLDSSGNTAVGYQALGSMVSGLSGLGFSHLGISTAVGFQALANANGSNVTANDAYGYHALFSLTDGNGNLAIGTQALSDLTEGVNNIGIGFDAGLGLTTGDANIYIGVFAGQGAASESSHTYIRNINITSVSGADTDTVTVDLNTGLLGHLTSSRRHKEDIKAMDNASENLYRLKPVTYRYKKEIDRTQALDYGLIAEDVAEIDPNLTARNREGQIESVRYNAINAMMLNEFLKEHQKVEEQARKVQEQEATIAKLKSAVARQQQGMEVLTAQLKEQAAQIQKVSAQIQMSKVSPKVVRNSP